MKNKYYVQFGFVALIIALISVFLLEKSRFEVKTESSKDLPEERNIEDPILVKESRLDKYELLHQEVTDEFYGVRLIEYILYKDTIYTQPSLENMLNSLYDTAKSKKLSQAQEAPSMIGIYLFASKEAYESDRSSWVAMLIKAPKDYSPKITYSLKQKALEGLGDKRKSTDEVELERLNNILKSRGLEMCSFARSIDKIYTENISKADKQYPDFGIDHMKYVDKLDDAAYARIMKKYKLSDKDLSRITSFAVAYCK